MPDKCKPNLTPFESKWRQRKSPSRRGKLFGRLTLLLAGALAGACQSTNPIPTSAIDPDSASFCQVAKAIYYSRHDTPPTIEQIREHNAVGAALKCGWLPAKSQKVTKP